MQQVYTLALNYYRHASTSKDIPATLVDLLTALNNVEMPVKNVPDQQVVDILVSGCKHLGLKSDAYSPFCKFMYKQCSKQIRLSSLRTAQFELCIVFLLDGLKATDTSAELKVDILRALSALVFENASSTVKFYPRVAEVLCGLADRTTRPLEVRRMAINCIGNTCAGAGSKLQPYYKDYYQVLLSNICTVEHGSHGTIMVASSQLDFTDSAVRKIASSTLRALQFVLSQDKTLVTNPLCDIVQIIHKFIFMSVSVQAYNHPSREESLVATAPRPIPMRQLIQQQQSRRAQFQWRLSETKIVGTTSSDSEVSDSSEVAAGNPRKQRDDAKIRINALLCLTAIAKTSPRALYPSWHKFLSDTFSIFLSNNSDQQGHLLPSMRSDNQPYSLFTVLLYDPMPTVRTAVCNTLIAMLDESKQYLGVASERDTKSSFTSLSEQLASILRDFHSTLICSLEKEDDPQVTTLVLKVVSTLVSNCPYDRLAPGYLSRLYSAILGQWKEASVSIRIAILQAVISILSTNSRDVPCLVNETGNGLPSLIKLLLELTAPSGTSEAYTELAAIAWEAFGAMAKSNLNIVFENWDVIQPQFDASIGHKEMSVRVEALKFAELCGSAMGVTLDSDDQALCDKAQMEKYVSWWTTMLEKTIQASCIDSEAPVRTVTCDCLSSMPKRVYEHMSCQHQTLAVALLLPLRTDQDANVRAAACRALGVFVLFPSRRDDEHFVADMASAIIEQMSDKALLVRVRASWAQGNLCDALVIESEKPGFSLREWISMSTWEKIVMTATSAATDNDKLRSNAVRAIGSLLRITPREYFQTGRNIQLIGNAMAGLTKNIEAGSLKTRWNACHAASNLLKNPDFPIGGSYPWTGALYSALIQSLLQCRNFKVRINACLALCAPTEREKYGDRFDAVTQAIYEALDSCHQEDDTFQEYRYREQLKEQARVALDHVQSLSLSPS